MMKKLLVMILVVGIASIAGAGLSFSAATAYCTVGDTVTVDLISETGGPSTSYVGYYANPGDAYAITGVSVIKGNLSSIEPVSGYAGYYEAIAASSDPLNPIVAGDTVFRIEFTGIAPGMYSIHLYEGDWYTLEGSIQTFTILVPEPVTICLLGVGGLFLRRRR